MQMSEKVENDLKQAIKGVNFYLVADAGYEELDAANKKGYRIYGANLERSEESDPVIIYRWIGKERTDSGFKAMGGMFESKYFTSCYKIIATENGVEIETASHDVMVDALYENIKQIKSKKE